MHLANLSFAQLHGLGAPELAPGLIEVSPALGGGRYWGGSRYFPELYLSQWFATRGDHVPIYCFDCTGVRPLARAYATLIERLAIDAVILIDGGTDGLMRGDEAGLGTPAEDVASIAAVDSLDLTKAVLICVGFGVDTYHGVSHAHFLEAVAELIRADGFLGAWSLTRDMPEVHQYREATEAVYQQMPQHPSIVSMSILSAINGEFGNYHATSRTAGSVLFINALMSLYWCFRVAPVAPRILYRDDVLATESHLDVLRVIERYRDGLEVLRPRVELPM